MFWPWICAIGRPLVEVIDSVHGDGAKVVSDVVVCVKVVSVCVNVVVCSVELG